MRLALAVLAAALVPFAGATSFAQAAECSGPLAASLTRIQVAYTLAPPPQGFAYATQPNIDPAAGDGVPVSVSASRNNGCPVASAAVTLQVREAGQAEFRTIRTGTTNQQGFALFTLKPVRLAELRASVTAADETAASAGLAVSVRRGLSASYAGGPGCILTATGRLYPRSASAPVWLQRRIVSGGKETGFLTLAKGQTDADGVYRLAYTAPCGADYALTTYAPAAQGNTAGRALYVDLHVAAKR